MYVGGDGVMQGIFMRIMGGKNTLKHYLRVFRLDKLYSEKAFAC